MRKIITWLQQQTELTVTLIGLLSVLLIGSLDYCVPYPIHSLFYVLVVMLVTWTTGMRVGVLIALAGTLGYTLVSWLEGQKSPLWMWIWNVGARLATLLLVAWIVARLKRTSGGLRKAVARRTAELEAEVDRRQRMETELRETLQQFQQVTEHIAEVFWMTNAEKTKMMYVSPAYEKIWGRTCESLYQAPRSWLEAIHLEDRERVSQAALSKQVTGEYDEQYRIQRPDGTWRWVRDRAFPVRDTTGAVCRLTGIAEDITALKQAEEEIKLVARLAAESPNPVLRLSQEGRVLYANPASELCLRALGSAVGECVPQRWRELMRLSIAGKRNEVVELQCEDRVYAASIVPVHEAGYVNLYGREITAFKKEELGKQALLSMGAELSAAGTPAQAGQAILACADKLWKWETATLDLYLPETDQAQHVLSIDIVEGERQETPQVRQTDVPTPRMRRVMREGPLLLLREPPFTQETDSVMTGDTSRLSASIMCVPLQRDDRPLGVFSIQSYTPNAYTGEDLRMLQSLADYGSGALDRILTTQRLHEQEMMLQSFFDSPGAGRGVVEVSGEDIRMLSANHALAAVFQETPENVHGKLASDLKLPRAVIAQWVANARQSLASETAVSFESFHPVPSPGRWELTTVSGLPSAATTTPRFALMTVDITERRRAEDFLRTAQATLELRVRERTAELEAANAALRQREGEVRTLVENSPDVIVRLDREARQIYVNPAAARLYGQPAQEMAGKSLRELGLPEAIWQPARDACERVFASGREETVELSHPFAGVMLCFEARLVPELGADGDATSILMICRDITERKQIEQALRKTRDTLEQRVHERTRELELANATLQESERTYRALIDTTGTGYLILSPEGLIEDANDEYVRVSGHQTLDQIRGKSVLHWTAPHDRQRKTATLEECAARGQVRNREFDYVGPQGQLVPVEINGTFVLTAHGPRILALCRDITDRRQAEVTLREREATQVALLNSVQESLLLLDREGVVLVANETVARRWGRPIREVVGHPAYDFMPPDLVASRKAQLEKAVRTRHLVHFEDVRAGRNIESFIYPVCDPTGRVTHIGVFGLDISERKRAEEKARAALLCLNAAQEEERVRIARELHDGINQTLAAVRMRLHRAQAWAETSSPPVEELLARCSDLLAEALEESRRIAHALHPVELQELGLAEVCRRFCKDFQAQNDVVAKCRFAGLPQRLPPILELNLFRIVQEGFANIEKHARAKTVRLRVAVHPGAVALSLQDDGRGFDSQAAARPRGQRQRRGLQNMRERAESLGGTCQVVSEPKQGTTVTVRVPYHSGN